MSSGRAGDPRADAVAWALNPMVSAALAPERPEQPLIAGRYRLASAADDEENGVDTKDGTPVLVRPKPASWSNVSFVEQEELERTAKIAASLGSPWVLPVLLATPRIVHAKPPPAGRPDAPLATADAVECLLQFCDVLSRAHAAGLVGIGADLHDVRVHREEGEWRISVVLPHLHAPARWPHTDMPPWTLSPVRRDLWTAVSLFRELLAGRQPEPHSSPFDEDRPAPLPRFGDDDAHAALWALLSDKAAEPTAEEAIAAAKRLVPFARRAVALKLALAAAKQAVPPKKAVPPMADAASLAARVLHLARDPADWQSRVAAMPRVSSVVAAPRDWDRLIELGTAELAAGQARDRNYVIYPLAAAYHQRGCAAYARGDPDTAMRDVEQALSVDRWARYLVTRGVLRVARGDHEGALSDYEEAVTLADAKEPPEGVHPFEWRPDRREPARAHYARGVARHRKGDVAGAGEDFRTAIQIIDDLLRDLREQKVDPDASLVALEGAARRALATVERAGART